jgi:hypothetical protein
MVNSWAALGMQLSIEQRGHSPIAVARALIDDRADQWQQPLIIGTRTAAASPASIKLQLLDKGGQTAIYCVLRPTAFLVALKLNSSAHPNPNRAPRSFRLLPGNNLIIHGIDSHDVKKASQRRLSFRPQSREARGIEVYEVLDVLCLSGCFSTPPYVGG